jgi:hypothetical protein
VGVEVGVVPEVGHLAQAVAVGVVLEVAIVRSLRPSQGT